MTPESFIRKWVAANLSERSAAQQHFLDLCALLGEPTPAEVDPDGDTYTFEKGGKTAMGGRGWADVWRKGVCAWEYKGPGKDLQAAYYQLKKYADALENPPLLITCDTKRIEIHTNFTNTVKTVHVLELADLADPAKREILKAAFTNPERLRPGVTRAQVTIEAAESFSELAHHLQAKAYEPQRVAHFLNRLIFCMFAEDAGLLPNKIFSKLVTASVSHPETFEVNAKQLFQGMSKGGPVAFEVIDWFNGGLFDNDDTLPLDVTDLKLVLKCAALDWSNIEPSIFGTLFERGLDPDKRSQQGAHYTDPDTIMKIVRPVVLEPLEREWEVEKAELAKQVERSKKSISKDALKRYFAFLERLHQFRVLDPACGSGNFLYLALRGLKDLEKRVIHEAEALGLPAQFPRVGPESVLGIEVNPYAAELARVTIWIGELQWMIENGFGSSKNPVLKPLDQIECRDAILNDDGTEPRWPTAAAIVGNPPFLGGSKMRSELGVSYTSRLRDLYADRVPGGADLVTYWFEKAREEIARGGVRAAGLVATNAIRYTTNRPVLQRIKDDTTIFRAFSDVPWVNEGAAVRVSLVCFGAGSEVLLDGKPVSDIQADLSEGGLGSAVNSAVPLLENAGRSFPGSKKHGAFQIPGELAREWLRLPNPHGKPNSDVVKPTRNGMDLSRRSRDSWIVDFGVDLSEAESSLYEVPFAHVVAHVRPERETNNREQYRRYWWRHGEPRVGLRRSLVELKRFIATPETAKHRFFVWLPTTVLPDNMVICIARDDDATFGVLSSRIHVCWALAVGGRMGEGNDPRYNPTVCFQTFPFPEGLTPNIPAQSVGESRVTKSIAEAAKRLDDLRTSWLNPPELVNRVMEVVPDFPERLIPKDVAAGKELKKRTLTNLYNANPTWLQHAHRELDEAVAAAYGWEWPLTDDEILKRLFELNQSRASTGLTKAISSI